MNQPIVECPKCTAEMIQGHVSEGTWYEPSSEKSVFMKILELNVFTLPYERKVTFRVFAYRCQSCGFLESYAHPELTPK